MASLAEELQTLDMRLDTCLCRLETAYKDKKEADDKYAIMLSDTKTMIITVKKAKADAIKTIERDKKHTLAGINDTLGNAAQTLLDCNE